MNRHLLFVHTFLIALLLSACGPASPKQPDFPILSTAAPTAETALLVIETAEPAQVAVGIDTSVLPTPTDTEIPATYTPIPATEIIAGLDLTTTVTPAPTFIVYFPTPTETILPPLDLPTELPRAPARVSWTGMPTYSGDSDPGLLFRVDYDPDAWAQTEGNFGDIVLGNRQIEYCTITPWTGRGLPIDWKVIHEFRYIGSASFDVNTVTVQDVIKFVSYTGGDGRVLTGFQVSFQDQREQCLQSAETILGTLRSYAAVPTIAPTNTPESSTPDITPTP